jgi:excinuclease UvrABC ATPase subunit
MKTNRETFISRNKQLFILLIEVGLDYLTFKQKLQHPCLGESQRINLATL